MIKISWTENKSNMEVLNMIDEPRQIIKMMGIRKTKFFGRIMRHDKFIIHIMEGKINGKRRREWQRKTYLENVKELLSLASYKKVKRLVNRREDWLLRQGKASK